MKMRMGLINLMTGAYLFTISCLRNKGPDRAFSRARRKRKDV
jgi:hypothetical protein